MFRLILTPQKWFADIKMLQTADFEIWRNHLCSFIPERDPSSDKRVYVAANDGKNLEAVDLSHIFDSCRTAGSLIQAVGDKVRQMQRDKIDQPGLIGSLMPKGGTRLSFSCDKIYI